MKTQRERTTRFRRIQHQAPECRNFGLRHGRRHARGDGVNSEHPGQRYKRQKQVSKGALLRLHPCIAYAVSGELPYPRGSGKRKLKNQAAYTRRAQASLAGVSCSSQLVSVLSL